MAKVREAIESLSFLRDKGIPYERVGRKATGLNPSIIAGQDSGAAGRISIFNLLVQAR